MRSTKSLFFSLLIGFTIAHTVCFAQNESVKGRFTVDFAKGCTGLQVNVTILPVGAGEPAWEDPRFYYDGYSTSKTGLETTSHTYTEPGDFYIAMFVKNTDIDKLDSVMVSILALEIPTFELHNCDAHQVMVEIQDDYYDRYRVDFTTTDSELVDPLSFSNAYDYGVASTPTIEVTGLFNESFDNCGSDNKTITTIDAIVDPDLNFVETTSEDNSGIIQLVTTLGENTVYNLERSLNGHDDFQFESVIEGAGHIIDPINASDDYHCFQINTFDACNSTTIQSNIVCSVSFDVFGTDNANTISWKTDTSLIESYRILRDDMELASISNPTITSYDDTDVICNKGYKYNVRPAFFKGFSTSVDTTVIANKSAELPAIGYPSSTVLNNEIVLNWGAPDTGEIPFKQYLIEKNIRDRAWKTLAASVDTTYTDLQPTFIGKHAYRIRYNDECGNLATPSPETVPIIVNQASIQGKNVTYEWNKYETWINGIRNYTLERVDEEGNILEEYDVLSGRSKEIAFNVNTSEDQMIRVRSESLDQEAKFTYSNTITTTLGTEMFLANVFTPDDNGPFENNKFIAKGPKVYNFKMEIYSRWGALLFTTTDNFNGWDGKVDGREAPEAVYIYKIYFDDEEMRSYTQTGSMMLMRKK